MASTFGNLRVSGCCQGNFVCKWTIKSFSKLDSQVGKFFQSEQFQLEDKGMEWFFRVYPGGENERSKEYVSCFMYMNGKRDFVKLKYHLSLSKSDGEVLFDGVCQDWYFLTSLGHGYSKPIKASDLVSKLIDDTLVVTMEATYCITYVKNGTVIHRDAEITSWVKLTDDLKNLWVNKEYSDCVIAVAGKEFPVHTAVLCARSKVFSAMFTHDTLEKDSRRVEITDFDKDTIDSFLEFIYSGTVRHMDFDLALELLRASDKYEVSDLKSYCSNCLVSLLNDENVCQLLVVADIYNGEKLRKHALVYFCENMSEGFFKSQRSVFDSRPNLLGDIVQGVISENQKLKYLKK